jgi:hypothetical protein
MSKQFQIILLLLLMLPYEGFCAAKARTTIKSDTIFIKALIVPVNQIEKFKHSREFNYDNQKPVNTGFWNIILLKISQFINQYLNISVVKIAFYSAVIVIFVVLLIKMLGGGFQSIMAKKIQYDQKITINDPRDIDEFNIEEIINMEVASGNYNHAVRYLFIKLLKQLSVNELIAWHNDKTNVDYFKELKLTDYSNEFKKITNFYEYVWYGKFPINKNQFEDIYEEFNKFYIRINAQK